MIEYETVKKNLYEKINHFQSTGEISGLPLFCANELEEIIKKKIFDLTNLEDARQACVLYGETTWDYFFAQSLSFSGFEILISGWNLLSSIQSELNQYVSKASLSAYLAIRYRNLGDKGASFRWALLTQAEDLLGNHPTGGGTGKHLLQIDFGLGLNFLEKIALIAKENADIRSNKWTIPESFSENILTKLIYQNPEYASFFAINTDVIEYKINTVYFNALLKKIDSTTSSTTDKGNQLENLATYLFILMPALIPRRNILDQTGSSEYDIVVSNHLFNTNIVTELLGRYFLVECKNWEDHVGVKDIGYFLYRMRLTHAKFGIVFAKNGITGEEEKAAKSLIRKSFHEDGNICIILDKNDFQRLQSASISFWPLLLEKIEQNRFGTPKNET